MAPADVEKTNLQLRDIVAKLQKADTDWQGQLQALRSAETLVRAAPDELSHYAQPLARALLYSKVPGWADEETKPGEDPIDSQRFRSLVALTVEVPEGAGASLADEFYSPSADMTVRARALQSLATAAQELSSPGSFLKPLPGITHDAMGTGTAALEGGGAAAIPQRAGRVVRASERSLAEARRAPPKAHANRFPEVGLKWASALLRKCDVRQHGIDLFGRDHFLLGRLLCTLGAFLEASKFAPQAVPLAAAVIELIRGARVHDSEEPYVRRAALLAASQALAAIPPASVASAMLGVTDTAGGAAAAQSSALAERLRWLRGWVQQTASQDPDANCLMMAGACGGLQEALASEALAALAAGEGLGGREGSGLLPFPQSSPKIDVTLPKIESLSLGR